MSSYERLQSVCELNGTTVTKFCFEIKKSKGNLATWKKGNFSAADLAAIHERFGVSSDYILGLTDEQTRLKKAIPMERPESDLATIENIKGLLAENNGIDIVTKLYKELQEEQKFFVLTWLIGYMISEGLPVNKILGNTKG